jgi:hypothetical protein
MLIVNCPKCGKPIKISNDDLNWNVSVYCENVHYHFARDLEKIEKSKPKDYERYEEMFERSSAFNDIHDMEMEMSNELC